jgi:type IV secretion system protein VirD4
MAGPLIGGRRPISWRLAIVVAFVAAYATARWLEGIFGVTWWINSRAGKRRNELLGSARFGDRADVRKLEATGGSPDRPRQGIRQAAPL